MVGVVILGYYNSIQYKVHVCINKLTVYSHITYSTTDIITDNSTFSYSLNMSLLELLLLLLAAGLAHQGLYVCSQVSLSNTTCVSLTLYCRMLLLVYTTAKDTC